jgi:hypothetical protein
MGILSTLDIEKSIDIGERQMVKMLFEFCRTNPELLLSIHRN